MVTFEKRQARSPIEMEAGSVRLSATACLVELEEDRKFQKRIQFSGNAFCQPCPGQRTFMNKHV
jgi:hypothetical protein